jgi:hypothetical protein
LPLSKWRGTVVSFSSISYTTLIYVKDYRISLSQSQLWINGWLAAAYWLSSLQPTIFWCTMFRLHFHLYDSNESDFWPPALSVWVYSWETYFPSCLGAPIWRSHWYTPSQGQELQFIQSLSMHTGTLTIFLSQANNTQSLLVPDGPSDYLVVDTVDTSMFVRMREMHLEAGHLVRAWWILMIGTARCALLLIF